MNRNPPPDDIRNDPEFVQFRNNLVLEYIDGACTLGAITLFQMPVLISRARRDSILCQLQFLEGPFNLAPQFMDDHLSFSPKNCEEGRYYTLVTSLFNHADVDHYVGNLKLFGQSCLRVHSSAGRSHTIALFFGAGVAGCLCAWGQYLLQMHNWRGILPSPRAWIGDYLGSWLEPMQTSVLDYTYSSVNAWRPVIGASGAGMGFLAMDLCIRYQAFKKKIRKFKEWWRNARINRPCNYLNVMFALGALLLDVVQLAFGGLFVAHDVIVLFQDVDPDVRGTSGQLIAYSLDSVCHSGHLGGFLFGLAYFYILNKSNRIKVSDKSLCYFYLKHAYPRR